MLWTVLEVSVLRVLFTKLENHNIKDFVWGGSVEPVLVVLKPITLDDLTALKALCNDLSANRDEKFLVGNLVEVFHMGLTRDPHSFPTPLEVSFAGSICFLRPFQVAVSGDAMKAMLHLRWLTRLVMCCRHDKLDEVRR